MLGIADRSKILQILAFIFEGDQKKSIERLRNLIDEGVDPASFLNDLLEIIYFILQRKNLGDNEADRLDEDFLISIEHGMPPTGGFGIGIDRLIMLITAQDQIREVLLFPQLRSKK